MRAEVTNNLMPQPAIVQFQRGRLLITKDFAISTPNYSDDRLRHAIRRAIGRLEVSTRLELMRAPEDPALPSLIVEVKRSGDFVQSSNEIESYGLQVSSQRAVIFHETVVGALRGLETFLQLVASDHDTYFVPAVKVQDEPRFRWRGLLIEHFQTLATDRGDQAKP